jgi:hypothetical protein
MASNIAGIAARISHVKKWHKYLKAALGTIGATAIWIAAISALQPNVDPPALPLLCLGINEWAVTNDYTTSITVSSVTYRVTIKEGFRTDLASISSALSKPLGITHDSPSIRRGALVHDALYASHLTSRDEADDILHAACIADGMQADKASAVYEAVHLWGWMPWDSAGSNRIATMRRLISVSK